MRAAMVSVAVLASCYSPRVSPGAPCSSEGTCPGSLICVDDHCVPPGTLPADAPEPRDAPRDVTIDGAIDAPLDAFVDLSLIAHWQFDDSPGNGALDSTGNGHTASCVGTCPMVVTGHLGMAYHFDGTQALTVPDTTDFRGNVTVTAWMYADLDATNMSILGKPVGADTDDSWQLEMRSTDNVSFSGGSVHYLNSPATVTANAWHHVAGTWDGTTKRLYVDGVMVASVAATLSYDTHLIFLGADQNGGTTTLYWTGSIDDIRVYNRALNDSEVALLAGQ